MIIDWLNQTKRGKFVQAFPYPGREEPRGNGDFENLADLRYDSLNKTETVVNHPLGKRDESI